MSNFNVILIAIMNDLNSVYKQFHKNILAVSFHYTQNMQDAEEITQEVFLKYDKIKHHDHTKAWLYRVAINMCFDNKRKLKRGINYLKNLVVQDHYDGQYELKDELKQLMKKLDSKTRMLFILKFMEEMDYQEISQIMQLPVGTLKSKVSRALKLLNGVS